MPTIKFSPSLYSQLGLKSWYRREPFLKTSSALLDEQGNSTVIDQPEPSDRAFEQGPNALGVVSDQELLSAKPVSQQGLDVFEEGSKGSIRHGDVVGVAEQHNTHVQVDSQALTKIKEKQSLDAEVDAKNLDLTIQSPDLFSDEVSSVNKSKADSEAIVLLGRGLDSIWENDDEAAWRLWQNITQAFGWKDKNVVFFDLDCLVSEDAVFSTMEEVIDLSVESVLAMDTEHPLAEQLAEGIHVIDVPDLESMLSDPYAKQAFYQTVMSQF